jgi:hypothetical protein
MRDVQMMFAELPDAQVVSLSDVGRIVGWTREQRSHAVRTGVVRPLPHRTARGYLLTRDEARLIIVAAALASAAGSAILTMIRAIRESGLDLASLAFRTAPKTT